MVKISDLLNSVAFVLEASMGQYDITIKDIFENDGRRFLSIFGITASSKIVKTEFPNSKNRFIDFLAEVESKHIIHIEFQSHIDHEMPYRMLEYYNLIMLNKFRQHKSRNPKDPFKVEISQFVVYLGNAKWPDDRLGFEHSHLSYKFNLVNTMDIEASEIIKQGDIGDAIFAILCRNGTSRSNIKNIIQRINQETPEKRDDIYVKLMLLAKLRKADKTVAKEYEDMSIVVNVEDIDMFRVPIDLAEARGKAEGKAEGKIEGKVEGLVIAIVNVLKSRFGEDVPDGVEEHLSGLRPHALTDMTSRLLTANSVDEVLGNYAPSRSRGP